MKPEQRLAELNIHLPQPPAAVANYVPVVVSGKQIWISGQVPVRDGGLGPLGLVGSDVTVEQAVEEARWCAINILAQLQANLTSLNAVKRIVKLQVFVASAPGFVAQPQVANGASDLMVEVFGDAGKHARSAVGVSSLPLGVPVEIDAVAEIV